MKYIKKPVPIEAVKLPSISEKHSIEEWDSILPDWFRATVGICIKTDCDNKGLYVHTRFGKEFATYGDYYIIRYSNGELGVCKASLFEKEYEACDTSNVSPN